ISTPQQRLPYLHLARKLKIAIEMAEALAHYVGGSFAPTQKQELSQWVTFLTQQEAVVRGVLEPTPGDPADVNQVPLQVRPEARPKAESAITAGSRPAEPRKPMPAGKERMKEDKVDGSRRRLGGD